MKEKNIILIINSKIEDLTEIAESADTEVEERVISKAQIELLNEIIEEYYKDNDSVIDKTLDEEVAKIIREYKTNTIFSTKKEYREKNNKILEYIYKSRNFEYFLDRAMQKLFAEKNELNEEIKILKRELRNSVSKAKIRNIIKLLKKSKLKGKENQIIDIKIEMLKLLL